MRAHAADNAGAWITAILAGRNVSAEALCARFHKPLPRRHRPIRFCRVADLDWRPGRVYFLTLLEPLAGTTGLWPLPPGRPASATVDLPRRDDERFTAHAAAGRGPGCRDWPGRALRVPAETSCPAAMMPPQTEADHSNSATISWCDTRSSQRLSACRAVSSTTARS